MPRKAQSVGAVKYTGWITTEIKDTPTHTLTSVLDMTLNNLMEIPVPEFGLKRRTLSMPLLSCPL